MERSQDFTIGSRESPVRASFTAQLFKPRSARPGAPEYFGVTLIIPKSAVQWIQALKENIQNVIIAEWGEKGIQRAKAGLIRSPILDGDGVSARSKKSGELNPGMGPDVVFIRAKSGLKPAAFTMSGALAEDDKEVYSGCYGKAKLHVFAWHNDDGGDGVSVGVNLFQMLAHGEKLGAGGDRLDPEGFVERVEDAGAAPAETTGGAGSGGLFA